MERRVPLAIAAAIVLFPLPGLAHHLQPDIILVSTGVETGDEYTIDRANVMREDEIVYYTQGVLRAVDGTMVIMDMAGSCANGYIAVQSWTAFNRRDEIIGSSIVPAEASYTRPGTPGRHVLEQACIETGW